MIYNYDDYNNINESLINESFNLNDLKKKIMNLKNIPTVINYLIKKFNNTINKNTRLKISRILLLIYMMSSPNNINISLNQSKFNNFSEEISNFESISKSKIENFVNQINDVYITNVLFNTNSRIFKDPSKLTLSDAGKQHIKEQELLKLTAYEIGDNKITIGYGHSEPINTSKYKRGDRINLEEAEKLFKKDVDYKVKCVRRMFRDWNNETGEKILVTQSMFDAIVSMVYNIGITGFRKTKLSEYIKNGDLLSASEIIKRTKISNNFPGLVNRRESEYDLFMKDINHNYNYILSNIR